MANLITGYFKRGAGPPPTDQITPKRVKGHATPDNRAPLRAAPVATERNGASNGIKYPSVAPNEKLLDMKVNEGEESEVEGLEEPATSKGPFVATPNPNAATVMPFQKQDFYLCPFKAAKRQCSHATGKFSSAKNRNNHVKVKHSKDNPTTTFDESVFEDGNIKIPCVKGCTSLFMSYSEAMKHGKTCQMPKKNSYSCLWKLYNGCDREFIDLKALANHTRSHVGDERSPYQCSKACGEFHADLYTLAVHESKCDGTGAIARDTTFRFPITALAEKNPPSILVIGRSSSSPPPSSWFAGSHSLTNGLPLWGKKILAHYVAYAKLSSPLSAILHASYQIPTRDIPALADDTSHLETKEYRRWNVHKAYKLTNLIQKDIKAANQAGIKPIILSVGLDGWACDIRMIKPWMENHKDLTFTLVLRITELHYGMSKKHMQEHSKIFWGVYDSDSISKALGDVLDEQGEATDERGEATDEKSEATDELIKAWRVLQDRKDMRSKNLIINGRNNVDFSASFPLVD